MIAIDARILWLLRCQKLVPFFFGEPEIAPPVAQSKITAPDHNLFNDSMKTVSDCIFQ